MINIAICDDDGTIRAQLRNLIEYEYPVGFSIKEYTNGRALVHDVESGIECYDLILLDIKMPWMGGIQAAARLRELRLPVVIVLLTQYPEYVYDGYEVQAFHYILKPLRSCDFLPVLERAVKAAENNRGKAYLPIRTQDEVWYIPLGDIAYIESSLRKVSVVTVSGGTHECYGRISGMAEFLKPAGFFRVHKSYLINPRNLTYVDIDEPAACFDSQRVPIARGKVTPLLAMMFDRCKEATRNPTH